MRKRLTGLYMVVLVQFLISLALLVYFLAVDVHQNMVDLSYFLGFSVQITL